MSQPNQPGHQGHDAAWYQDDSGKQAKPFPFGNPENVQPEQQNPAQQHVQQQAPQHYNSAQQAPQQVQQPQVPGQNVPFTASGTNPFTGTPQVTPNQPDQGTTPDGYGAPAQPGQQAPHHVAQTQPGGQNPHQGYQNQQYGQRQSQHEYQEPAPTQHPNPGTHYQQDGVPGILDPRTGDIMPVPDLNQLQDTDALLVVVSGPDAGAQILLDTDVVTVGRSPNADIFLDDVTVSRKHAEFVRTPSGFTLRDTGSLNGTYVSRQLIDSIELRNGADVQIGKFRMIFQQRPRQ